MGSYTIQKQIYLSASIEKVFRALTTNKEIVQFYPLITVESDWRVGSEILYKGEINGHPFTDFGVIEKLSFPNLYEYRYWSSNHGTEQTAENYITIGYSLKESGRGTLLKLQQTNINSVELYEHMNNSMWDFLLNSLKEYIEADT